MDASEHVKPSELRQLPEKVEGNEFLKKRRQIQRKLGSTSAPDCSTKRSKL